MKTFLQRRIEEICRQLDLLEKERGTPELFTWGNPHFRVWRRLNKEFVALMVREQRLLSRQYFKPSE